MLLNFLADPPSSKKGWLGVVIGFRLQELYMFRDVTIEWSKSCSTSARKAHVDAMDVLL